MKKKLIEYKMKLTGDYLNVFETIEQYIECSDSMYEKKEECLEEILDLLLTAQENGRVPEEVIGKDIKIFCNNILKGINYHSFVFYMALRLVGISATALFMSMFFMVSYNVLGVQGTVVVGSQISIIYVFGIAVSTVVLDFFIDYYFRKQIAKNGKNKYAKYKGKIRLILVMLSSILFTLIQGMDFHKTYTTIPRMLLIFAIALLLVAVINCIERCGGLGDLYGTTYNKSKKIGILKTGLYMKYEKKKAKNIRKNRDYSVELFSKRQKKEIEISHIFFCILLPFIIGEVCLCGYLILTKDIGAGIFILFIFILALMMINIIFILLKKPQLKLLQELCGEQIDNENKIKMV